VPVKPYNSIILSLIVVSRTIIAAMTLTDEQKFNLEIKAGAIFTPASPVQSREFFSGRKDQIKKVLDAVNQVGQHCIVYGERGVGKTSLAHVLQFFIPLYNPDIKILPIRVSCDSSDNYDSVFFKIFRLLPPLKNTLRFVPSNKSGQSSIEFPEDPVEIGEVTPDLARDILTPYGKEYRLYIIIDEFDCLLDERIQLFSDTIKNFSDYIAPITLILVGVAESATELVDSHASVERALKQVQMPRMNRDEIGQIIKNGIKELGLSYTSEALEFIVTISKGLPHYAHLLSLFSVRSCIQMGGKTVDFICVRNAIDDALEDNHVIKNDYYAATTSPRETNYPGVLLACALANTDEQGWFSQKDVSLAFGKLSNKTPLIQNVARHMNSFCSDDRNNVLCMRGEKRNYKFRFKNPLMQPYVILKGINSKAILIDSPLIK
jgi:Cdc6-like AAA superfamily ATPase